MSESNTSDIFCYEFNIVCINLTGNLPPSFKNGNVTLSVIVGTSYNELLILTVEDNENDKITLTLNEDAPTGVSLDSESKTLRWINVPDMDEGRIEITASDGNSSSLWAPQIFLCKCQVSC